MKRFVASRSIALVLRGVPGIYFHGLVGTVNDVEAVIHTKSKRDINRRSYDTKELLGHLKDHNSKLSYIVDQLGKLLTIRVEQAAFHPDGKQQIFMFSTEVFTVLRTSLNGQEHILALTNITDKEVSVEIDLAQLGVNETQWYDLVCQRGWMVCQRGWIAQEQELAVKLQPYDVIWLTPFVELEKSIESGC